MKLIILGSGDRRETPLERRQHSSAQHPKEITDPVRIFRRGSTARMSQSVNRTGG